MQGYDTVEQRKPHHAAGLEDVEFDEFFDDDEGEANRRAEEQRQLHMAAFAMNLLKTRDEAVQARAAAKVEQRWLDDLDAYHGRDDVNRGELGMTQQAANGSQSTTKDNKKPARSTVIVNITRSKTNAAEARLADMLFPVDDRNWGIKPTPVPELNDQAKHGDTKITHLGQPMMIDDGQGGQRQATAKDLAQEVIKRASEAAKAMELEIDDQLTECQYNGVGREIIHDAALLGTGVIKGPFITSRIRKQWQPVQSNGKVVHVLNFIRNLRPASERVSPWNLFPDPKCGDDIHAGEYIWERRYVTKKHLKKLALTDGYMADQIAAVLREAPQRTPTYYDEYQQHLMREAGYSVPDSSQYELWEYHGDANPEDLRLAGCELPEDEDVISLSTAHILMVNGRVIFADINPLDTGDFPYDVFVWEKVDGLVWGYGIPHLMRYAQQVMTAAWRMVMDHGGSTVGPQVGIKRSKVTPADGRYEITGRKLWYINDDEPDAMKAMAVWDIPSHIKEYLTIIEAALKFADDETNMPMIAQGERGTAPDTVGGMTILMNAANVVLRRLVKQFDDCVTRPHIRRYYDYNMQYSEKAHIKGDYEVDARGSTALLIKDLQNQAMMKWLQALQNPALGYMLDDEKLLTMALQADHLIPDQVMADPEKREERRQFILAAAGKGDGGDEATIKIAEMRIAAEQQKLAAATRNSDADRAARREERMLERENLILKYANEKNLTIEKVKAQLASVALREQGQNRRFAAEEALKNKHGTGI